MGIEEIYAPEVNDFVYITDDAYSANDIKQMELRILKAIKCDLGDPLPINFLRRFSKAGDEDVEWTASLEYYTGYKLDDVVDMVDRAMKSLQKMHSGQFTAIKNKYSTKSMLEIVNNATLLAKLNHTPA